MIVPSLRSWSRGSVVLVFAFAFVMVLLAAWIWDRPSDFYGCVLSKMQGEPEGMISYAARICGRKYGFPAQQ